MAAAQSSLTSVKDYAVDRAAKSDVRFKGTVFQLGIDAAETSPTGQEECRLYHTAGGRKDGPLLSLNFGSSRSCQQDPAACLPAQLSSVF